MRGVPTPKRLPLKDPLGVRLACPGYASQSEYFGRGRRAGPAPQQSNGGRIVTYGESRAGGCRPGRAAARRLCRGPRGCGLGNPRGSAADELPDSAFVEDTVGCAAFAVPARLSAERAARGGGHRAGGRRRSGLDSRGSRGPARSTAATCSSVGDDAVRRPRRADQRGGHPPAAPVVHRGATRWSPVPLRRVLHLKSAVTALPDGTLIAADPSLVDTSPLPPIRTVPEESRRRTSSRSAGARS